MESKENAENAGLRHLEASSIDLSAVLAFLHSGIPGQAGEALEGLFLRIGDDQLKSPLLRLYITTDIHLTAKRFSESIGVSREVFVTLCGCVDDVVRQYGSCERMKRYLSDILEKCVVLRSMISLNESHAAIEKSKAFIADHFCDVELSLENVAAAVNVNPAYFSSLFKKEVGEGFVGYVTSMRIRKAKELLCCSPKKISEVAYEVGYNDYRYFSCLFRRITGLSPSMFRKCSNKI